MRKQPYPVALLTKGEDVSVDPIFLMDPASPNTRNVVLEAGKVKKGPGRSLHGIAGANAGQLPLSGAVLAVDSFKVYNGTVYPLVTTEDYTHRYSSANSLYVRLNANDAWTGNATNRFTGVSTFDANGSDVFVITNGKDEIKYWNANVSDDLANLTGWGNSSITARTLLAAASRLLAGYTVESGSACPRRVRWSMSGNIANITGTGSGFVDLVDTADNVVKLASIKNRTFVIKENSIWEMVYIGGANTFKPDLLVDGVGSDSPDGVIDLGDALLIYSRDEEIYLFDGASLKPVTGGIRDRLFHTSNAVVNPSAASRVCGYYNKNSREVYLNFPSTYNLLTTEEFIFNLIYNSWTRRNRETTAYGSGLVSEEIPWNTLTANWANLTWTWLTDLSVAGPNILMGLSDGNMYSYTGNETSNDYMCYETKDFRLSQEHRWIELLVDVKGDESRVRASHDGGLTWGDPFTLPAANTWTTYKVPINTTSDVVRFMFESFANSFELRSFMPWYISRVRSSNVTSVSR